MTTRLAMHSILESMACMKFTASFLTVSRQNFFGNAVALGSWAPFSSSCWDTKKVHSGAAVSLFGFGKKQAVKVEIVQAGDPVLHEPAAEVVQSEVRSEAVQKVIGQMVEAMRQAPGCGLAAPQIGVPLQIIVLEDTEEYISYAPREETKAQERYPFELLVVINPKLKTKGRKTAKFFEGCLSVNGYRGLIERHLEVEVTGLDRDGLPLKIEASGWKARILQHECDHLSGTLYVDKLIPRTFRTVNNLSMPLARGCPQPGAGSSRDHNQKL